MVLTCADLFTKFLPNAVYTCSDEISVVFPKRLIETHHYGGRSEKVLSCISAYTSIRFNYHISNQTRDDELVC